MSAIPGAIRAVHDVMQANLPDVEVIVGPGTTNTGAQKYVLIGVDDPDESTYAHAVTGQQSWAQLGGLKRDETFTIHGAAIAWNGNADALQAMDDVFSLLAGLEQALVSDPTLTQSVLYSVGLTAMALKFSQDDNGAAAIVPFDLECKARI